MTSSGCDNCRGKLPSGWICCYATHPGQRHMSWTLLEDVSSGAAVLEPETAIRDLLGAKR